MRQLTNHGTSSSSWSHRALLALLSGGGYAAMLPARHACFLDSSTTKHCHPDSDDNYSHLASLMPQPPLGRHVRELLLHRPRGGLLPFICCNI